MFTLLLDRVGEIVDEPTDINEKLLSICRLLKNNVPHYNWVGFYLVYQPGELALGPFIGELTEHTRIPFGKGICGQAAEKGVTFIIQDVSKEVNYLSCSPKVQSEIVVPIFKNREIVGELDIDSHNLSSFTEEDVKFLENVCRVVSRLI